jgi:hypothetical protein
VCICQCGNIFNVNGSIQLIILGSGVSKLVAAAENLTMSASLYRNRGLEESNPACWRNGVMKRNGG